MLFSGPMADKGLLMHCIECCLVDPMADEGCMSVVLVWSWESK